MNQLDQRSALEVILGNKSLSNSWNVLENLSKIQKGLFARITSLRQIKTSLESNRITSQKAKADLLTLNSQLANQRIVVLSTVEEKNTLLKQTKKSESSYRKVLADKQAMKDSFEREINNYESQLRLAVDASKLPHPGSGILSWPLDTVSITQYFGNTAFATANAQIYSGKGHSGIDLRASIGTPVKASLSGVVAGVANTDKIYGCYSYGKWVMLKHEDGLSTLYAHLSLQTVKVGQQVATGQVIGYSGNTGYTTGPHLHFGVYATQGVQILTLTSSKNCRGATLPVADYKGYLNPLSYL
jgi:murein DD-endopeptidase MepM/ murein hydrolase activator NlpD